MLLGFRETLMFQGERFPLVLERATNNADLIEIANKHKDALEHRLLQHGAILFRGFAVRSVDCFDRVVSLFSKNRADYVFRSTPRTALARGIYTTTEYPPERDIPLHNENAYQREWPLKLAFACLIPATSGGETPLADMRRVTASLPATLLESFESKGVCYTRHFHRNFDLAWQDVFQTTDPGAVAAYCDSHRIEYEWIDPSTLRTAQVCQGIAEHPITKERAFFNQAHLFHVSSLGREMSALMIEAFGAHQLPRHATYGDGIEIDDHDLAVIRDAFQSAAKTFPWESGDVVLIDNMQIAHGRRPFSGERKVLAALLEPYSPIELKTSDDALEPVPAE